MENYIMRYIVELWLVTVNYNRYNRCRGARITEVPLRIIILVTRAATLAHARARPRGIVAYH